MADRGALPVVLGDRTAFHGAMTTRRRPRLPIAAAGRAHGVLTSQDLQDHGMGRQAIDHALRGGELVRLARGLYAVAGSPDTEHRRAIAATSALRGGLSHRSSAAWWEVPGFELEPFDVMRFRPGSSDAPPLARLHRPCRLRPEHMTEWRDVPITRPSRTLFDLAATVHPLLVARTYDTMWARGLVTTVSMDRMLEQLRGRGRPGIRLMRELIEERRGRVQPAGSRLEVRFESLNRRADIPLLRRQVHAGDDEDWLGRMDFAGAERALIVEIDSDLHHAALTDSQRDERQTAALEAAGWHVVRFSEHDVWNDGARVARDLREAWFRAPRRRPHD